jgi:hypothetical protein
MRRRPTFTRTLLASGVITLLLFTGCGEQHPKSPLGAKLETSQDAAGLGKKTNGPADANTAPSSETRIERSSPLNLASMEAGDLSYSQLVPAGAGGTLYFDEFEFYVPPGSLSQNTVISITVTSDGYLQMDFGPDGTQFNPPATMTVSYAAANLKGLKPSNLSISWFDTAAKQWINIGGTVDQSAKTVSAPISHFTEYSLSTR